ncbi:MAG: alpha/beta fold hydrolase [Actinomycetota bacterium]|nr:alpha/beta fold hydrolase [Actinomycetota bacterium]MDD5667063.1 alpha/beta fold hydrolase [Actinomycetota bacterium]
MAWAAATGMGVWLAYSYAKTNKTVPASEEAEAYARSLLERVGLGELYGSWSESEMELTDRTLALYHFKGGPGDPVMVFVPGTSVYALLYTEYMYKLSKQGFNVVGFDPRGHGGSSGKRGVYTLGELVEDAMAVIDYAIATYGGRVAVSGSSQGGMVAFYCAAAEPRLKAAVCHNVIAPDEPDNERMTRWPLLFRPMMPFLAQLRPVMASPLGSLMTPVSLYLDLKAETSRLIPDVGRFLKEDPLAVNAVSISALHSLASTPLARRVEEIETPVMVIHAGRDNIFPEDYVRRVYDRLTCEKEFLYLPDAPHLVITDYVDDIIPPVSSWLKRVMER